MLPKLYRYLDKEPGPKMILEGLKLFGIKEQSGTGNNLELLAWGREIGVGQIYSADSIPWCGLFVGVVAKRAGKTLPDNPLWARNWLKFGHTVPDAELGDVIVFARGSAGHVAMYVGESKDNYYILGGNQSDQVSIVKKSKKDALGVRRPDYSIQPSNIRRIYLDGGSTSIKES